MAQSLNTPKVETRTVNSVEVTSITVDYANDKTEIQYLTYLDDGTPFKRGRLIEEGTTMLNNTSVYARVITHIEEN